MVSVWFLGSVLSYSADPPGPSPAAPAHLTLSGLVRRVLERNETIQGRILDSKASWRRSRGEWGVFEPELTGSVGREANNRENTAEQETSLLTPTFHETNNVYEGGLDVLIPSGARLRLGYNLRDLKNNLQPLRGVTNSEYQSFLGVSVSQPLLRNFGTGATMAGIRLSAISNNIVFQEYRRELMAVVSATEGIYWNLFLAQEQARFFEESMKTAETILKDNRTRLEAGKGSELEVLESEAGLGLRRAKLGEARQKLLEAANRVVSLYAEDVKPGGGMVRAADTPALRQELPDYSLLREAAFQLNPDFLAAKAKIEQSLVRLGYARNQRLPQLDLKSSYGLNGLGQSPADSWTDIEHQNEPSWFIGLELRIPLGGGIRSRHELAAARLELDSARMSLLGLHTEIVNGMNTAWHKLQSTQESVSNYQASVRYNRSLLDSALARFEAGKLESRKVLEIEAELFESRLSVAESLVRYQLAALELEVIQGALLQRRNLDITQAELQAATKGLLRNRYEPRN
jgi:outer membrane protein TolC